MHTSNKYKCSLHNLLRTRRKPAIATYPSRLGAFSIKVASEVTIGLVAFLPILTLLNMKIISQIAFSTGNSILQNRVHDNFLISFDSFQRIYRSLITGILLTQNSQENVFKTKILLTKIFSSG